jgi:pyruvate/2-oxoglutarate dehydrogenase complex dihydrolipoamide dehydrogenase (E3) component
VPEHLLIVGGGYTGLEFGRMFRRFGSMVTIIHRGSHVLTREDPDIAEAVQEIFREDGIRIVTRADTTRAFEDTDGKVNLELDGSGGQETISGSHLLIAVGRTPNTDMLNLSATGVRTDENNYVVTDPKLRTSVEGIWALGDVKGGPAFTHISFDDYRVVRKNLLEGGDVSIENRLVPYVVYIDPQLGRVGYSEGQANDLGLKFKAVTMPMNWVARALEVDESRGLMKGLVDTETGKILGFACLGIEGGEIMAMVQTAMMGGLTWKDLSEAVYAHPSLAESLNNLFGQVDK